MNSLIDSSQYSAVLRDGLQRLQIQPQTEFGYMEFGCGSGDSLTIAQRVFSDYSVRYVAFDSFAGLPYGAEQESEGVFQEGQFSFSREAFSQNLEKNAFPLDRLTLCEGWFKDVFPVSRPIIPKVDYKFFMFDCDLYSSTKSALEFFVDFFQKDCIVVMDDWFAGGQFNNKSGQPFAFREFQEKNQKTIKADWIGCYEYAGRLAGKYYKVTKTTS